MKRILIAAAIWFAGCAGALAQQTGPIYCGQQATLSVTGSAQIIGSSGSTTPTVAGTPRIYICGWSVSAAAISVVTFTYGTGTNCAGGVTNTGPTIQFGAQGTAVDSSPMFRGWEIPPSNALCAAGTSASIVTLYYAQQ